MAIPPEFLEELKLRLPATDVVGRRVKLVRSGRDTKGCCPFHKEKTPSFHVYEDHYHCFGCGAHGSVIDFVMETEGLEFREAVARLASEAGMAMPEETPEERQRQARNRSLAEVVEMAAAFFEKCLRMPEGRPALDYLRGRGLTEETIKRFRLGFSPDGRGKLKSMLAAEGIEESAMVAAGLLVQPEDRNREPYDRFRGRVMFPITDRQGRVIAFGARLLAGDGPKYLNSPETSLFHKGRNLYGLAQAKEAVREHGSIVVCEGYTDVIALAQAGIGQAVAPLGTALTEEQIALLWKLAPEPILCFDGDAAGQRAAARAAERALPLLKAGFGLRFAMLPPGEDPDSLVQGKGRAALDEVLEGATALSELIWRVESGGSLPPTPEGRADLNKRLDQKLRDIPDPTVRRYFQEFFEDRLWPDGRAKPGTKRPRSGNFQWRENESKIFQTREDRERAFKKKSAMSQAQQAIREVVALIAYHPILLDELDEFIAMNEVENDEAFEGLRLALIDFAAMDIERNYTQFEKWVLSSQHKKSFLIFKNHPLYGSRSDIQPTAELPRVRAMANDNCARFQRTKNDSEARAQIKKTNGEFSEDEWARMRAEISAQLETEEDFSDAS